MTVTVTKIPKFSPIVRLALSRIKNQGLNSENIYLSYSESTQVMGYGAIGGPTNSGFIQKHTRP